MRPDAYMRVCPTLAILFVFICPHISAQSTAALLGSVLDPSGAVLPGVRIIARNEATGFARVSETDGQGSYLLAALPVGVYRIEAQHQPSISTVQEFKIHGELFEFLLSRYSRGCTIAKSTRGQALDWPSCARRWNV